jgi:hypothetical protein
MKNKTLTYVLLAVVALVWFKVFVRLKDNFVATDVTAGRQNRQVEFRNISKPKSFSLSANYRDPFLAGNHNQPKPVADPSNMTLREYKVPKPKPEPKIVYWPAIKYYGFVRNNSTKNPRLIVQIDGVIYKLHTKDEILDNIQVISADGDKMKLKYLNEIKVFYRK